MAQSLLKMCLIFSLLCLASAQLRRNFYAQTCPNVEAIVREAVGRKLRQTFTTASGTLRLFFHDCFVQGCDASVILVSTANNKAEKDSADDITLPGDAFDTVIKAKAAIDAIPQCRFKVSCADVLAIAARDVVAMTGGPFFEVELGRRDGRVSRESDVHGHLPLPEFKLDQLVSMFASHGLTLEDMVALSGGHTIGFSHCNRFTNRLFDYNRRFPVDPSMNATYAKQLQVQCPRNVDPNIAVGMDSVTPFAFDNQYFKNLLQGKGMFTSDQVLYTDPRSRSIVELFARNNQAFNVAFANAMTKLGRVGVKTGNQGEIRRDCAFVN
ncbi:Peroxidase 51 [Nymphaea thermarum]|nr:Peroxidase 51 [Nymphaea thermarum]